MFSTRIRFDSFSASNSVGPGHAENQDSLFTDPSTLTFAVADGVGGYQGGKEASELAIGAIRNNAGLIRDEASLSSVISEIHEQLKQTANSLHYPGMGTTIAVAKIIPKDESRGKFITGNTGDSPILYFPQDNADEIVKVYSDDSYRGSSPSSMFAITQYLGIDDSKFELAVHTQTREYTSGDILMLCSDGVTDNLQPSNSGYLPRRSANLPELVRRYGSAKKIVEAAIEAGVKADDMTVVLVFL